jgi:hypothetical protein
MSAVVRCALTAMLSWTPHHQTDTNIFSRKVSAKDTRFTTLDDVVVRLFGEIAAA